MIRQSIEEKVISKGVCLDLDTLSKLKGIENNDYASRRNMKSWIVRNYGKRIVFLSCEAKKGQLIMSKESMDGVSQGGRRLYDTVPLSDKL